MTSGLVWPLPRIGKKGWSSRWHEAASGPEPFLKLIPLLLASFPGSKHVRDFSLTREQDVPLWSFAAQKMMPTPPLEGGAPRRRHRARTLSVRWVVAVSRSSTLQGDRSCQPRPWRAARLAVGFAGGNDRQTLSPVLVDGYRFSPTSHHNTDRSHPGNSSARESRSPDPPGNPD